MASRMVANTMWTFLSIVISGLLASVTMTLGAQAPFELPVATGKTPIGTTRWVVTDTARQETFATGQPRQVAVIAWYPAVASVAPTAPYMRDGMEEVLSLARLAKLGNAYDGLAAVKTHAVLDAMPAASPARFPVIVFSHGFTGLPSSHTSLFEGLASHGWAVLSVVHPYEAAAAKLADGTVITFLNEKGTMHQGILDVLNEWGPEDGTMEKVTAATDEAEKLKLLRGYLATLKNTDAVVKRWVLDTKVVLDRLPRDAAAGRLAAKLDLSRLGIQVLPRRRHRHAAHRFHRHELLGRAPQAARRLRSNCAGARQRGDAHDRPRVLRARDSRAEVRPAGRRAAVGRRHRRTITKAVRVCQI